MIRRDLLRGLQVAAAVLAVLASVAWLVGGLP